MLQHCWKIALLDLYLIFLFFVHHGWKIAPVLYIYPSTGTENNTEPLLPYHSSLLQFALTIVIRSTKPHTKMLITWTRPSRGRVQMWTFGGGGGDVINSLSTSTLCDESCCPVGALAPFGQPTPSIFIKRSCITEGSTAISLLAPDNSRLIIWFCTQHKTHYGYIKSGALVCQSYLGPWLIMH